MARASGKYASYLSQDQPELLEIYKMQITPDAKAVEFVDAQTSANYGDNEITVNLLQQFRLLPNLSALDECLSEREQMID